MTPPEEFADAISTGLRPSCSAEVRCNPPNSTLDAVSEPVSATPSQPSSVPRRRDWSARPWRGSRWDRPPLAKTQIGALTTAQLVSLDADRIAAFTTDQIVALTTRQAKSLTTTQIDNLTTTNISAMDATQVAAFTPAQVQSMDDNQIVAYLNVS
mgnify:CR=1 FL=1